MMWVMQMWGFFCAFVSGVALLLVVLVAGQWLLVDLFTPFILFPVLGAVWLLYFTVLPLSAWIAFKSRKKAWIVTFSFSSLCGLAAWFDPFTPLWLKAYFVQYEAERTQAVQAVYRDALPHAAHNPSVRILPSTGPILSMGGNEVIVEEHEGGTYVLFFTFRGILDNYAGYLFVPDGGESRMFGDLSKGATEIHQLKKNWFYVSHH